VNAADVLLVNFFVFSTQQVKVTFKRFGRKHTVPALMAPEKLTRQQRRRRFAKGLHVRAISKRSHEVRQKWEAIARHAQKQGQPVGGPRYNSYENLGGGDGPSALGGASKASASAAAGSP
jgi:hypothetical protein